MNPNLVMTLDKSPAPVPAPWAAPPPACDAAGARPPWEPRTIISYTCSMPSG